MSDGRNHVICYRSYEVVGAVVLIEGKTGFDQGNLVVQEPASTDFFEVFTYISESEATAKRMTAVEFQALIDTGQALRFAGKDVVLPQRIPAFTGGRFWVFRGSLVFEGFLSTEMHQRNMVKAPFVAIGAKGIGYIVDVRKDCRAEWAKRYRQEAFELACRIKTDPELAQYWSREANHQACVSFYLEPTLTVFSLAMVVWTVDNLEKADGYLMMAYKTRGPHFRQQVEKYVVTLEHARTTAVEVGMLMAPLEVVS